MKSAINETEAVAINTAVTPCDDIGYLVSIEYKCPYCCALQSYSRLFDFDEMFSNKKALVIKAGCDQCGQIAVINFADHKND